MKLRDALARAVDDDPDLPPVVGTFLRGLSVGALVGAAIAGSVLMQRRRARKQAPGPAGGAASPAGS